MLILGVCHGTVLHDAAAAELVAPVDEHHLAGELGQEERFLESAIASTHDRYLAVAEEEAVAGGAGGHTASAQARLVLQVEPDGRGAGGHDDRVGGVLGSAGGDTERTPAEVDPLDVHVVDTRPEALRLRAHVGHQGRSVDALGEAREVLDLRGDHELPTGHEAGDDDRFQVGTRSVDGGRQSGRTAADDEHACVRSVAAAGTDGRGRAGLLHRDRGEGRDGRRVGVVLEDLQAPEACVVVVHPAHPSMTG